MPQVKFENLEIGSIKGAIVFLDVDGTLVSDKGQALETGIVKKVYSLSSSNHIFLCSNSKDLNRNIKFKEILNIKSVGGLYRKPSKKLLIEAIKLLPPDVSIRAGTMRKIVIGDTHIIDGRFANNIGADFIRVSRIKSENDDLHAKFLYLLDNIYTLLFIK